MELERKHEGKWRSDAAEKEAQCLRNQIRINGEANQEMAYQERLQQQQEKELRQELQLVRKLGMVRAHAAEMEKRRTKPY